MESEHISRFVFNKLGEDAKRRFYAPTVTNSMQMLCDKLRVGVNLIAGRPRMGCSSLAISMAVALAKEGRSVLFITNHRQGFYSQLSRNLAVEFGLDASKFSDLSSCNEVYYWNNDTLAINWALFEVEDNIGSAYLEINKK